MSESKLCPMTEFLPCGSKVVASLSEGSVNDTNIKVSRWLEGYTCSCVCVSVCVCVCASVRVFV